MRLVIIGGNAAGMSVASKAKRNRPELDIIVFEQGHDVSYSACGMPYNIADPESLVDSLVVRPASVFIEKEGVDLRLGHRVLSIDRKNHSVRGDTSEGDAFECTYDRLVIATGASSEMPEIPGIDAQGVVALKTLNDGRRIKSLLQGTSLSSAVIMGMGYIALEMAEALRKRGVGVAMIKPRKRILPWLHEDLAGVVRSELEKSGVELYAGHGIRSIEKGASGLTVKADGVDLHCQMLLAAMGVRANSGMALDAGLEAGPENSISVDRFTRTSDPDIYAVGDCADAYHVVTGEKVWIPLALQANRSGRVAADNICGKTLELRGIAGTGVFKVFNLQVGRTGLNPQEAEAAGFDPAEIAMESRSRAHSHPGSKTIYLSMTGDKKSGRLLGVQMVGEEGVAHRLDAVAVALYNKMTVDDFWQTDMAYSPPFSPAWDPLLTAANLLGKKL